MLRQFAARASLAPLAAAVWFTCFTAAVVSAAERFCASDSCPAATTGAPTRGPNVRPQDEVWIVSSRGLCVSTPDATVRQLRYQRYFDNRGWVTTQFADFATQPEEMVTSFFIVGNYYTHGEMIQAGWLAYHRLIAACAEGVKLRFVIYSWPSDPAHRRRLRDAKIKLGRVDPSAYHLAALIDRLDPATPISLCGSSYGAGIASGAVQLLSGDRLGHLQLAQRSGASRRIRLVLLGAAIDNDSFVPGRKYDSVLPQVERALVFVNPSDLVLRVYHFLFGRRSGYVAMGRSGPVGMPRVTHGHKVDLVRSDPYLGRQHGMGPYWRSTALVARMRPYLLMQPLDAPRVIQSARR